MTAAYSDVTLHIDSSEFSCYLSITETVACLLSRSWRCVSVSFQNHFFRTKYRL